MYGHRTQPDHGSAPACHTWEATTCVATFQGHISSRRSQGANASQATYLIFSGATAGNKRRGKEAGAAALPGVDGREPPGGPLDLSQYIPNLGRALFQVRKEPLAGPGGIVAQRSWFGISTLCIGRAGGLGVQAL
jgi:hypothetical protein